MELLVRFTREEAILNSYGSGGEVRTVKDEEMIDDVLADIRQNEQEGGEHGTD